MLGTLVLIFGFLEHFCETRFGAPKFTDFCHTSFLETPGNPGGFSQCSAPKKREFAPNVPCSKIEWMLQNSKMRGRDTAGRRRQGRRRRQRTTKATANRRGQGTGYGGRDGTSCADFVKRALTAPTRVAACQRATSIAHGVRPSQQRCHRVPCKRAFRLPKSERLAKPRDGGNASHAAGICRCDRLYMYPWPISTKIFGHVADWVASRWWPRGWRREIFLAKWLTSSWPRLATKRHKRTQE